MPRYIDANKLEELCDIMAEKCDGIGESIWNQFRTMVEFSPTADVVEVVRCRDCKYWKTVDACVAKFCTCIVNTEVMKDEDDYCSLGKRKDNED